MIKQLVYKGVLGSMHLLGSRRLLDYAGYFFNQFARGLTPEEGLRFLLELDSRLYFMTGQCAVAYGNGKHPKHELTKYHDFFVERIQSADHVLDIGCGYGALAYSIATRSGARVTAVDIIQEKIDIAEEKYSAPNITYACVDASQRIPVQACDVIVLSNVLEHLAARPQFLHRLQQQTHAKRWLVRVPLFEREWRVPLKKKLGLEWRLDRTHETEYTLASFTEEMQAASLAITHLEIRWGEIWSELKPLPKRTLYGPLT
jgi:SAM-dependent methyltransferase